MQGNWTLVFAAIGAIAGLITSWDKIMAWIDGARAKQANDARLWRLSMDRDPANARRYRAVLRYDADRGTPIRLESVGVVAPRGALVSQIEWHSNRVLTKAAGVTKVGRDLNNRVIAGDQLALQIVLPQRSPWLWRDRRVRLLVNVEECSGRRRSFRVKVKGQTLDA